LKGDWYYLNLSFFSPFESFPSFFFISILKASMKLHTSIILRNLYFSFGENQYEYAIEGSLKPTWRPRVHLEVQTILPGARPVWFLPLTSTWLASAMVVEAAMLLLVLPTEDLAVPLCMAEMEVLASTLLLASSAAGVMTMLLPEEQAVASVMSKVHRAVLRLVAMRELVLWHFSPS
jgi:hypothetical protein